MDKDLIITGIGALTSVAGCARWLIQVYYKKAKENEILRKKLTDQSIGALSGAVDDLKDDIKVLGGDLREVSKEMRESVKEIMGFTHSVSKLATSNNQRIAAAENVIQGLSSKPRSGNANEGSK